MPLYTPYYLPSALLTLPSALLTLPSLFIISSTMSSKIRPLQFLPYSPLQFTLPIHTINNPQGFMPPTHPNLFKESLFDRYYRPNLRLIECAAGDIQMVNRDILIAEGQMSESLLQEVNFQSRKSKEGRPVESAVHTEHQQSEECKQNEAMFNAKKIVDENMGRQKGFLTAMEQKIMQLETQAALLSQMQEEEKIEIEEVKLMQARAEEQLTKEQFIEQVNRIADEALAAGTQKERNLHLYMPKEEINEVLEDHYSKNHQLIDQVYRVTHQGFQREKSASKQTRTAIPVQTASNLKPGKQIVKVTEVSKRWSKERRDQKN